MQIVIDIPEELYDYSKNEISVTDKIKHEQRRILLEAIKNGTLLPKRHGRLIDAKDVGEYLTLADVPTIIDSDKEK